MKNASYIVPPAIRIRWSTSDLPEILGKTSDTNDLLSRFKPFKPETYAWSESEPELVRRRGDGCCRTCLNRWERYLTENGRKAQIVVLFLVGAILLWGMGLLWILVWRYEQGVDPRPKRRVSALIEGLWVAWTFMSDGGTQAKNYHTEQRWLGGLITAAGIIYLNVVMAFIVDMVRESMMVFRMGKGSVIETGHCVILNWSDKAIPLIREVCAANAPFGGGVVVVLAKESVEMMRAELDIQLPKPARAGTLVLLRFGDPVAVNELVMVRTDQAAAVIILASGTHTHAEADSATLRSILSLRSTGFTPLGFSVAEVLDIDNETLISLVGRGAVETFVSHDVLRRLMLMSVRQTGLADVWDELLGFYGNEFYVKAWPQLEGVSFGELLTYFPNAVPVGILSRNPEQSLHLNPSLDYCISDIDSVIVIAEQHDSYYPQDIPAPIDVGHIPQIAPIERAREKLLICGWRRDMTKILRVLEAQSEHGSEVHIMTHTVSNENRRQSLLDEGLDVDQLKNISLHQFYGNTSVRKRLEQLPLETYTSCLIFADYAYDEDAMQADSHSLATLVLIRNIQASRQQYVSTPITCEVLDARTHRMITKQKNLGLLSQFVQTNRFVAQILAMVSKQRYIKKMFQELLGANGNCVVMMPSAWVVLPGENLSFWIVSKRVAMRNAVLIGYQSFNGNKVTILNPRNKTEPMSWNKLDLAIIAGNRPIDGCDLFNKEETGSDMERSSRTLGSTKVRRTLVSGDAAPLFERQSLNLDPPDESMRSHSNYLKAIERPSVDTAMNETVRLGANFFPLMTGTEQQRFGSSLMNLGELVKGNSLQNGASTRLYKTFGGATSRSFGELL